MPRYRSKEALRLAGRIISDLRFVTGDDGSSQRRRYIMCMMVAELARGEHTAGQARHLSRRLYGKNSQWKREQEFYKENGRWKILSMEI